MVQVVNLSRRRLFDFGAALVAAPAIVRVSALMPISVPKPHRGFTAEELQALSDEFVQRFFERGSHIGETFGLATLLKDTDPTVGGVNPLNSFTRYAWKKLPTHVAPKISRRTAGFWTNTATA